LATPFTQVGRRRQFFLLGLGHPSFFQQGLDRLLVAKAFNFAGNSFWLNVKSLKSAGMISIKMKYSLIFLTA